MSVRDELFFLQMMIIMGVIALVILAIIVSKYLSSRNLIAITINDVLRLWQI